MGDIFLNGIKYAGGVSNIFDPTIYSESERKIGVWTDGKPIYQKTFQITTPANTNVIEQVQDVSSLNIDTVVNVFGHYKDAAINWGLNIYFNTGRSSNVFINGAKTYISMLVNDNVALNKTAYVTALYTKTTDVAGSGSWTPSGVPSVHYSTNETVVGTWIDGKPVYERLIDLNGFSINRDNWYSLNIPASTYNIKSFVEHGSLYQDYNGFIQVFPCAVGIMSNTYIGVDVKWDGSTTSRAFKYLRIQYTKTTD